MTERGWNFADVWERVADRVPDALAQRQGDREYTWAEFDRRADGIAATLLAAGVVEQDKVAHYLYNCPEYLESSYGAFKAGLAIANTNYRYAADELVYLWTNADAVAVDLPRHVRRAVRRRPRSRAGGPPVDLGRRRVGSVPRVGRPVRTGRRLGNRTRRRAVGSLRRSPVAAVHGWHHRACRRA